MSEETKPKKPVDTFIEISGVPITYLDKAVVEQMREYCEQKVDPSITMSIPLLERGEGGILDILDENGGVFPDWKYK